MLRCFDSYTFGTYLKNLDVKTLLFISSNRGYQRCDGQKSHLSQSVSFVPNERLAYEYVDNGLNSVGGTICHGGKKNETQTANSEEEASQLANQPKDSSQKNTSYSVTS